MTTYYTDPKTKEQMKPVQSGTLTMSTSYSAHCEICGSTLHKCGRRQEADQGYKHLHGKAEEYRREILNESKWNLILAVILAVSLWMNWILFVLLY
jgi:hypothetical protein